MSNDAPPTWEETTAAEPTWDETVGTEKVAPSDAVVPAMAIGPMGFIPPPSMFAPSVSRQGTDEEIVRRATELSPIPTIPSIKEQAPSLGERFPTRTGMATIGGLAPPPSAFVQAPPATDTEVQAGREAVNLMLGIPRFATSLQGVLGGIAGAAAPLATTAAFTADVLKNFGSTILSTYKNWNRMTPPERVAALEDIGGTGILGTLLGRSTVRQAKARFGITPTVTETTPPVPPSEIPKTPSETGLLPAVRKVGGEVAVGEAGQTHPEIMKEREIPREDVDQRVFVKQATGEVLDREQAAAETPQIPTATEPERRHSTDLPEAQPEKPPTVATPEDWAKWQALQAKPITEEGVWAEREALKNKYGGNVPLPPPEAAPEPAAPAAEPAKLAEQWILDQSNKASKTPLGKSSPDAALKVISEWIRKGETPEGKIPEEVQDALMRSLGATKDLETGETLDISSPDWPRTGTLLDFLEKRAQERIPPSPPPTAPKAKPFEVDEQLVMRSPHTGDDTVVSYRGAMPDGKAVVWTGQSQFPVPMEWLRRKGERAPTVASEGPKPSVPSTGAPAPPLPQPTPIPQAKVREPSSMFKAELIDELVGPKMSYETTSQWEARKRKYGSFTKSELASRVASTRANLQHEQLVHSALQSIIPGIQKAADDSGLAWKSRLRGLADEAGVAYHPPADTTKGDAVYTLSRALAEKQLKQPPPTPPSASVTEAGTKPLTKAKQNALDSASKAADQLIALGEKYSSATMPQRMKKQSESALIRMRSAAAKLGIEVPSAGTWFLPGVNADMARMVKKRIAELKQPTPAAPPPSAGPAPETGKGPTASLINPPDTTIEAGAGVTIPGLEKFTQDDLIPAMAEVAKTMKESAQQVHALLSPATVSAQSKLASEVIRESKAKLAQDDLRAREKFANAKAKMDRMEPADALRFIDSIESGASQPTPELDALARQLRDGYAPRIAAVRAVNRNALQHLIQDYFPHIWKDPDAAVSWYARILGRRPLRGPASFLKQRTIPTTADGVAAGLEPVTYNPVELTLLKYHEMDRYVMGQKIFQELKDKNLAKFSRSDIPPEGYAKIDDRVANVVEYRPTTRAGGAPGAPERVLRGHWYVQEDAARVLNNFLSPGLERYRWFRSLRWTGNTLNMAQLGFSGYHFMFTMIDSSTAKLALGIQQLAEGKPKGLLTAARGVLGVPGINQLEYYIKGSKVLKEYTRPGSVGGDYAKIVDSLLAGGGRVEMPRIFKNSSLENFLTALRSGNYPGAVVRAPFALIEGVSYPLMQNIVPRLKLGAFSDMALHELERLGPVASREAIRSKMAAAWDSVDNRMGELVYDNLFWNRTLKDLSFLTVRAVGWNLGTIRELGGAVKDTATIIQRLRSRDNAVSRRMAYTVALPITVATMGAMYQYLKTGQPPQELKDYFYPKTGKILPDGTPERVNFPSYLKDIGSYSRHPLITLGHKLHPMWSTVVDMLNNRDFYQTQIHNPDDPLVKQVRQEMEFLAKTFVPFSVRGAQRRVGAKESPLTKGESFFGIMPISPEIARTPSQQKIMEYAVRRRMQGAATPEERSRYELRKEAEAMLQSPEDFAAAKEQLLKAQREGKLTPGQRQYQAGKLRFQTQQMNLGKSKADAQWLWRFKHLDLDEAQTVYDAATPAERKLFQRELDRKRIKAGIRPEPAWEDTTPEK